MQFYRYFPVFGDLSMTTLRPSAYSIGILARTFIALVGGFVLANLVALLISYFYVDNKIDAIMAGLMISFIVYAVTCIYVFSVKSAYTAGFVVTGLIIALLLVTYFLEKVYPS